MTISIIIRHQQYQYQTWYDYEYCNNS